ncbi:MAG: right-handed parallel beta-helix repeat-containing protein [Candidatus Gracilibacteria bacterium]|nr:right-handed parallel beta-helix repeat-containing protein [Candidatus Gracilibacteria bacterium]
MKYKKNTYQGLFLSLLIVATLFVSFWQLREFSWAATTYVVCPTLTVGCTHTSIAAALTAARTGDVIEVRAGTYKEEGLSTDTKDLKMTGVGGPVISGSNTAPILTISRGTVSISGIRFLASGKGKANGINVSLATATISNCILTDLTGTAIAVDQGTVTLSDNNISGSSYGVTASTTSTLTMNNNTISGIANAGVVLSYTSVLNSSTGNNINTSGANGIELSSSSATLGNNNLIYSNADNGIAVASGTLNITGTGNQIYSNGSDGIETSGATFTVKYSKIYSNGAAGINATAASTCTSIDQNAIYANGTAGIEMDAVTACTIDNNTIDGNDSGIRANSASTATVTDNAITYNTSYGLYNSSSTITGNYNAYFGNGTNLSGQSAGANDLFVNPFYTDRDSDDFTLQAKSLLVGTADEGQNIGWDQTQSTARSVTEGVMVQASINGNTPLNGGDSEIPSEAMAALTDVRSALSWASSLLYIEEGEYSDQGISVTQSNTTIQGEGAELVTITGDTSAPIISVANSLSDISIAGLTFLDSGAGTAHAISIGTGTGTKTVSNSVFSEISGTAILSLGSLTATGNTIHGVTTDNGIYVSGANICSITENLIYDVENGIYLYNLPVSSVCTITNNTIDNTSNGIVGYRFGGLTCNTVPNIKTGGYLDPCPILRPKNNAISYNTTGIYITDEKLAVESNYNNFWGNSVNSQFPFGLPPQTLGTNELYVNPFYTNLDSDDYSLLDYSLLAGTSEAGANIGYESDAVVAVREESTGVILGTSIDANTPGVTADSIVASHAYNATKAAKTRLTWTVGTLNFLAGTYNNFTLTADGAGTTLQGEGAATTTINNNGSNPNFTVSAANITIDGFTLDNSAAGSVNTLSIGNYAGATVSNNLFTSANSSSIYLTGANNNTLIEDNIFRESAGAAISITSSANPTIQRNLITSGAGDGININGASATIDNNTIVANSGDGIEITSASAAVVITDNTINENGVGINSSDADSSNSYNNIWNNTVDFSAGVAAAASDLSVNPFFAETVNYTLQDYSLLVDTGQDGVNLGYQPAASLSARAVETGVIVDDELVGNTPGTSADNTDPEQALKALDLVRGRLLWASGKLYFAAGTYDGLALTISQANTTLQGAGAASVTITNRETTDPILIISADNVTVDGLKFLREFEGGEDLTRIIDVSGCVISNNIFDASISGLAFVQLFGANNNTILEDNIFRNVGNTALDVSLDSNLTIQRNLFYNGSNNAIKIAVGATATIDQNTIHSFGVHGVWITQTPISPVVITNNIFSNNVTAISSSDANVENSYNNFWNNTNNYFNGVSTGTGEIYINPFYTDAANADFSLQDYSLCAGTASDNSSDLGYAPSAGTAQRTADQTVYVATTINGNTPLSTADTTILQDAENAAQRVIVALGWETADINVASGTYAQTLVIDTPNLSLTGVSNPTITSSSNPTILIDGSETSTILGVISGFGLVNSGNGHVVSFDGTMGMQVSGNTISGAGDGSSGSGIYIDAFASDIMIADNNISNMGGDGIASSPDSSAYAEITGNIIHDNFDNGINLQGLGAEMTLNHIYHNERHGIRIASPEALSLVSQNTIDRNGSFGIEQSNSSAPTIKNNILSLNEEGGIYCSDSTTFDYNNIWSNGILEYNDECSLGENMISSNPLFQDYLNADYDLCSASSSLDAGEGGVNIGAYEGAGESGCPHRENSYISTTGDDSTGDGSSASPWETLTHAAQYTSTGSVSVAAGTYDGSGESFPIRLAKGILISGDGNTTTHFSFGNPISNGLLLYGDQTIEKINFEGIPDDGAYYALKVIGDNTVLRNNIFDGNSISDGVNALLVKDVEDVEVFNNLFFDLSKGVYCLGTTTYSGCQANVSNNTLYSIDAVAIEAESGEVGAANIDAQNNIITDSNLGISRSFTATVSSTYNNYYNNSTNYSGVSQGTGDIFTDPLFVAAENYDFHLSHVEAGQVSTSAAFDAGSATAVSLGLNTTTSRSDSYPDLGTVDLGYHYLGNTTPVVTLDNDFDRWNRGELTINYNLIDEEAATLNISQTASTGIEYSTDGSNWYDATDAGGASEGLTGLAGSSYPGTDHVFIWDTDTDLANTEDDVVYIRIRANDGSLNAVSWVTSTSFGIDNVSPTISTASVLSVPISTDDALTVVPGEITEGYPDRTLYYYKKNAGSYSTPIAADIVEGDTTSPGNIEIGLTEYTDTALDGDDSLQVKVEHLDKYGNSTSAESEVYYVTPLTPEAPSLSNADTSSIDISVVEHESELGDVDYAIYVTSATPQNAYAPEDTAWVGKYVSADGTPSVTPVWQSQSEWDTITLSDLQQYNEYCLKTKAANPASVTASSDFSEEACQATTYESPTLNINSASQSSNGDGIVNISITAANAVGLDLQAKIEYSSSLEGTYTATTLTGTATASYQDSGGLPDINNSSSYQLGSGTNTRIVSASAESVVSNNVTFAWNSKSDLPDREGTYYLKVTLSDGTVEVIDSTSLTIDNINPAVSSAVAFSTGTLTSGTTFALTASFTETNPNTNEFAYNLNNAGYSVYSAGDSNTASPAAKSFLTTLDGNDCLNGIKAKHTDDFGNYIVSENTTTVCVYPLVPAAPTVSNPTLSSLDVSVNANGNEAASETVLYAIQISSSTPTDSNWNEKYINALGLPSATPVWQTASTWDTVTLSDTDPDTSYTVRTKAANPQNTSIASAWSDTTTRRPANYLNSNGEGGGPWSDSDSWEELEGVTPASVTPTAIDRVTILSGDTITLDSSETSIRSVIIESGGTLAFSSSTAQTLQSTENITLDGNLRIYGGDVLEMESDSSSQSGMNGIIVGSTGELHVTGDAKNLATITAVTKDSLHNAYIYAQDGAYLSLDYADLSYLGANYENRYGFYINSVDGSVKSEGLSLTNSKIHHNYHGVYLSNASNSNTITNNEIYSNNGYGIHLVDSDSNNISNNSIHNNGSHGLYLLNADSNTPVSSNSVYSNVGNGIYLVNSTKNTLNSNTVYSNSQNGFYLFQDSDQNTLTSNTSRSNSQDGFKFNLADSNVLFRNFSYSNTLRGVFVGDSSGNSILNSGIYKNANSGIAIEGNSDTNRIENATVYDNGVFGISIRGDVDPEDQPDTNTIKNSIITMNDSTELTVSNANGTILDYNNIYDTDNKELSGISADANSISADPLFLNNSTPDIHLNSVSPSRDAGNPSSSYTNEPEPNGNRINQGAYGNTIEAASSTVTVVINSVTQATDGSGYVTVNYSLTNGSPLQHSMKIEYSQDNGQTYYDPHLIARSTGTLNNNETYQLQNLTPGIEGATFVWDSKNSLNKNGSLDSLFEDDMRIKLTTYAEVDNAPVTSSQFELDNKLPAVTEAVAFVNPPTTADTQLTLGVAFSEDNPYLNQFAYALNTETYGAYLTGQYNTASPSDLIASLSQALDGDDYFSKLKALHRDTLGNETITESLVPVYITPLIPSKPSASNITNSSAKVIVKANSQETGNVLYAIYIDDTSPEDSVWNSKYLNQSGNPSATPVYQTLATWGGTTGITMNDLNENTSYFVKVKASNPKSQTTTSAFSSGLELKTSGATAQTASISGSVFQDQNQNGTPEANEAGIPNISVRLYSDSNANGIFESSDTIIDTDQTSSSGHFAFTSLPLSTYFVQVNSSGIPENYLSTGEETLKVILNSDFSAAYFGYYVEEEPTVIEYGSISGKVFSDADRDGKLDAGEQALTGIELSLKLASVSVASVDTNSQGNFNFPELVAGSYTVSLDPPSGMEITTAENLSVTLATGENKTGLLFGLYAEEEQTEESCSDGILNQDEEGIDCGGVCPPCTEEPSANTATISGIVYIDQNMNSGFDNSDLAIAAANLVLYRAADNTAIASSESGTNGSYLFSAVANGNYVVRIDESNLGADLIAITDSSQNVNILNQNSKANVDFAYYLYEESTPAEDDEPSAEDELEIRDDDPEEIKAEKESKIQEEISDTIELAEQEVLFATKKRSLNLSIDEGNGISVTPDTDVQVMVNAGDKAVLRVETLLEYRGLKVDTLYPHDYDGDGIYNLNFKSPHLGEHNLKTVIYYADGSIATIENKVIVDPEGYIYETLSDGQEKRISNALITLYHLNNLSNEYEAWPAINFNQVNPQITQKQGTYQFLVPSGKYYLEIEAPGYHSKQTDIFEVNVTRPIHLNIELQARFRINTALLKYLLIILALALISWLTIHTRHSYKQRQQSAGKKKISR